MKRIVILAVVAMCAWSTHPTLAAPAMRIASGTVTPRVVLRSGTLTVHVATSGVHLDFRHVWKANVSGRGHLQYYLDAIPKDAHTRVDRSHGFIAAVGTSTFSFNLKASRIQVTAGKHHLIAALARNNGTLYRVPTHAMAFTVK
jgi:hypothetical protein